MKRKILSLLTAFAMVFGIIAAPFTASANEVEKQVFTEKVTLHKILMDTKTQASGKDKTDWNHFGENGVQKGINDEEYTGDKIANIQNYFGGSAKNIGGVYFAWAKKDTDGKFYWIKDDGNFTATKTEVDESKLDSIPDDTFGGLTEKDKGKEFATNNFKGEYKIYEIHSKSTYVGDNGETLTDMKAVPVVITLPLVNKKGVVTHAHVYPKNIEEKPETHKDFKKEFKKEQPNGRTEEAKEAADPETHNVGDVIDYTVTTKVPANSKWKTAFWDDKMTEGLTFVQRKDVTDKQEGDKLYNKGLTVKYGDADMDASWYQLSETADGFTLELTEKGLTEIAKAKEDKIIRIDYSATLNEKAVVAIPESNDVTFHYGNNPHKGNTPKPNKPNDNGEMKVTKTWADGVPAAGEWAEFTLYNAQTGKKVGTVKFTTDENGTTTTYTKNDDYVAIGNEKPQGPSTKTDAKDNNSKDTWTFTWTGLDKDIEYKVVEKNNMKETATYGKGANGEITITNNKWNNPDPINPNEPKVVTYGAKFVKTNEDGSERLAGAEFVVRNSDKKFLTAKDNVATRTEYETAQKAFLDAVQAYNNAIKDNKTISDTNKVKIGSAEYSSADEAKAEIKKLETRRDMLWNASLKDMTKWTGETKDAADNIKLTSNAEGQFEIAGLAPGKYTLVEVKEPTGYVDAKKATLEFEFEIKADGSQATQNIDFGIKDDKVDDNAKQIINRKVSIPQTGGIGSLVFIAAGLAIMGGAFIAYRRSQATA